MAEDNINEETGDLVEITVNEQSFMVPKQMAAAMRAQNEQFKGQLNETKSAYEARINSLNSQFSSEIDSLKPPPATEPDDDFDARFFQSPRSVLEKYKQEIKDELRGEYKTETSVKQAEKEFWAAFYKENEDLKEHKLVVDAITQRDTEELKVKPIEEIKKIIADRVRSYLLTLVPKAADPVHTEAPTYGVNNPGIPAPDAQPDPKVLSLSDQVRKIAENRNKARIKLKQAR